MNNKASDRLAGDAIEAAKQPYATPKLWEFGRVYLATAGPSATGMADGNSGMAMA
ncbi:MAG: hypothetical protein IPG84_00955 [Betaproteobacteria bacterium]|nr:hypothetical protein [Betaproteobacteria bacterium]